MSLIRFLFIAVLLSRCERSIAPPASTPTISNSTQSTEIIFAGLSGMDPKFIDSGPDRGTGWMEFETQQIRRALIDQGFKIRVEYMTPARIEHEFRSRSPICTWPTPWKDPKSKFREKPDRIFSIPLKLSGDDRHSILIHAGEIHRFQRHRTKNGDLDIQGLLLDPTLKTLLVRDFDYGPLSQSVSETSPSGDTVVRPEFRKSIQIRVIRESRQLLEMLNAHRFDYIISDAIEEKDYARAGIDRRSFLEIAFNTSRIEDARDPSLILNSVSCSIHPETFRMMPYINQGIASSRDEHTLNAIHDYKSKIDPGERVGLTRNSEITWRLHSSLTSGSLDFWYPSQQKHFPDLLLFPPPPPNVAAPKITKKESKLLWRAKSFEKDSWILYQTLDIDPGPLLYPSRRLYGSDKQLYHRDNFSKYLPPAVIELLDQPLEATHESPELISILRQMGKPKRLIFFARALEKANTPIIEQWSQFLPLEELWLFDAHALVSKALIHPQKHLKRLFALHSQLDLTEVHTLSENPLMELHLNGSEILSSQLVDLLSRLPSTTESLSLGYLRTAWTPEAARALKNRDLPRIKYLDLEQNALNDNELFPIVRSKARSLEVLKIGSNRLSPDATAQVLRGAFPKIKEIDFHLNFVSSKYGPKVVIPPSVSRMNFRGVPLNKGSFWNITLPKRLKYLDVGGYDFSRERIGAKEMKHIVDRLDDQVELLSFAECQLDPEAFLPLFTNSHIATIRTLDLSYNRVDDRVIEALIRSRIKIEHLILESNLIRNQGAKRIAENLAHQLKTLNLSRNPISNDGLFPLIDHFSPNLDHLFLANLYSIDFSKLGQGLPKHLKTLDLGGNWISDRDLELLAPHLPSSLRSLNLSDSSFGNRGAIALANAFPKGLQQLNLTSSPLRERALEVLFSALPNELRDLWFGGMAFSNFDFDSIAHSLPPSLALLHVVIPQKQVELEPLLSRLPRGLFYLTIYGGVFPKSDCAEITSKLSQLRSLWLSGTVVPDSCLKTFSQALPSSLESIWFVGTGTTDHRLAEITARPLPFLWRLNLSRNPIGKETITNLTRHKNIRHVLISGSQISDELLELITPDFIAGIEDIHMGNNPLTARGLISFFKKIDSHLALSMQSTRIRYSDLDAIIPAFPKLLTGFGISGSDIGHEGYLKVRKAIEDIKRKSHFEFDLEE